MSKCPLSTLTLTVGNRLEISRIQYVTVLRMVSPLSLLALTVYVLSKNVHIYGRHIYHRYAKIYKISSLCPWLDLVSAIGIYRSYVTVTQGVKKEKHLDVD